MITKILLWFKKNKEWFKPSKENNLFWFQIIIVWVTMVPLYRNIVKGKTEGLTLTLYITMVTFFFMGLTLAISSYKADRIKKRLQLIIVYAQLTFVLSAFFVVSANKIPWVKGDTIMCIVVYSLSIASIGLSHVYMNVKGNLKDRVQDPIVRGLIAIWSKALPQLWFAWTMIDQKGSDGLPFITLIGGHLNAWPRFIHVVLSGRKSGWDRATKGLLMSELSNVGTWTIASIVWSYFQIQSG
ncbi:MAG: hypothetical protein KKF46_00535 [Nanoarchaeota archaeon]|nr:hypothetical protein [Nanoarchaeota archaeon]MBU1320821.1 hypothetical protein [Nanoarchaeota archaeon]MBU1596831.1 hypothetical protein [Nanoarchaeota archaeon]MBU2440899.1 hypothetical protein [Nanoarchaeota archaeon]